MNLAHLLARHEGKTLEFKRDISSPSHVLRTIIAFSNSSGGVILIGIEDKSRNVIGVDNPLDVQEKLANFISTRIAAPLMPAIEILPWRNKSVIAVEVFPSYSRPHYLISEGQERGVYIRVGPSNRRADSQMQEELKRTVSNISYDEQPVSELNSEDVDFRVASELFEPVRTLKKRDLESLHLLVKHQKRLVPTIGGMILFGVARNTHFPDAWIQVGRFAGTTRTNIIDTRDLYDYPAKAINQAFEFLLKHAQLSYKIEAIRRKEHWSIPLPAVREAIINAVVHADYSQKGAPIRILMFDDRIVVENPGLLPFGLTIEDIQQGVSKLRNRVIGRVFKELGLIEQWGSGISRMIESCHEHGLPSPTFQEIGTCFRTCIKLEGNAKQLIDDVDNQILKAINATKGLTTKQIAETIGTSTRTARTRLKTLVNKGLITEIGSSSTDPKRIYIASEEIRKRGV